jgi:hypothetical protein
MENINLRYRKKVNLTLYGLLILIPVFRIRLPDPQSYTKYNFILHHEYKMKYFRPQSFQ